jgi:hypothetical protein
MIRSVGQPASYLVILSEVLSILSEAKDLCNSRGYA